MAKTILGAFLALLSFQVFAQKQLGKLTVEKIMRDPVWMGSSPSRPDWSNDASVLYFSWNPDGNPSDSTYKISPGQKTPIKANPLEYREMASKGNYNYNNARTAFVYAQDGDIYYKEIKSGKTTRITETSDFESGAQFGFADRRIVYLRSQNLYSWNIATGETQQLTLVRSGGAGEGPVRGGDNNRRGNRQAGNPQEEWLEKDQLQYFEVLRERKAKRAASEAYNKTLRKPETRSISLDGKSLQGLAISPDGRFVTYRLYKPAANVKNTIIPNFVTESGFTTDIPGRSKVGAAQGSSELFLYDRVMDTIIAIKGDDKIPGIRDLPDYLADYPKAQEKAKKANALREVSFGSFSWSPNGSHAIVEVRASDNKDRWIMLFDTATRSLKPIDRQHDNAWISGPGIGFGATGWLDENNYYFQSERTGYSHLYRVNVLTGEQKALTEGKYEVLRTQLSQDKKWFYLLTNEVHPGEQHYYRLPVAGGKAEKLTSMVGANQVSLSADEKWLAILHSYSNQPWELYLQENKPGAKPIQITHKARSEEFNSYPWKDPEIVQIPARDGAAIYARLYKPANPDPNKPAVLFVHGAGYLQNAHKWWSSYFREYMFNNMLADNGYYVLDIDYRGSAGYGRDWRTGIYRWMGGKDLSDQVDAVQYLVKNYGVNPNRVGLYGGSYGGFITLMALFTEPNVFKAGAALRPVTDWAQYNHGYTSNILNEPYTDSIAYRKSSPLYFAEGLKGHLLICHGMVDVNVHFQDAVKLTQRLIELGKDNWELAAYPMEDHGFVEPSSWTDEYKRIFKLFEMQLKK